MLFFITWLPSCYDKRIRAYLFDQSYYSASFTLRITLLLKPYSKVILYGPTIDP